MPAFAGVEWCRAFRPRLKFGFRMDSVNFSSSAADQTSEADASGAAKPFRFWPVVKPAFDRGIAIVGLVTLLPFLLLIAAAVRLDSPGSVLFRQARFGKGSKVVMVTKFRTMRHDMADMGGRMQAARGDGRVTRLGQFLRSTCLDELPQLWDVACGRLSLVGPRPHPLEMEVEGKRADLVILDYHERHRVKPGITGLAQIMGNRGPVTSIAMGQARIGYDIAYANDISFTKDMRIILATLIVPFRRNVCY